MARKSALRYAIFAREYVIDLNGTRAAIAAGYKPSTAKEQASRLLTKRSVSSLVDKHLATRASKTDLKAEHIVEELRRLAFSNMMDYMEIDENGKPCGLNMSNLTRDQAAAIQEITEDTTGGSGDGERRLVLRTKFKLSDKAKNLELLGRHLGMFKDVTEHQGLDGLAEAVALLRQKKTETK